jgi:hypothetical protein
LLPDFRTLSLPINIVVFIAFAGLVWYAGTRITSYASTYLGGLVLLYRLR